MRFGAAMGDRIAHRGPDGAGCWADAESGVSLAHRRLAIIDLSPLGHQPMTSVSDDLVMVFNGEIYNFQEMRAWVDSVRPTSWRGHSDTEVLLEAFSVFGVEAALQRANGMFAIALWDKRKRTLTLARDRIGEKPLYYGRSGSTFLFASELKAFAAHPAWKPALNEAVIPSYLRYGYVPAPHSIYRGVGKLPAGSQVTVSLDGQAADPQNYWILPIPSPSGGDFEEQLDGLHKALRESVRLRMVSDVPLGAFLSGGIDSSLITAVMQEQSSAPVKSFSIGFDVAALDEAPFAKTVAAHLGTDHTELYVSASEAMALAPQLGETYDEPFADSSQMPTMLLSRLVRSHVTVALSGDAGDELFGGYVRYEVLQKCQRLLSSAPRPLRRAAAAALGVAPLEILRTLVGVAAPNLASRVQRHQVDRMRQLLSQDTAQSVYLNLMSQISSLSDLVDLPEQPGLLMDGALWAGIKPAGAWAAYADALTYLPDDILVKVDRASMASSLEVRVPFLDPQIIQIASRMSWSDKTRGELKHPLKVLLARYLPTEIFDRPKMGFGVPLGAWLRGELRNWAEDLLSRDVGLAQGILNQAEIDRLWSEHLSGAADHASALWTVLMLRDWSSRSVH